MLYDNHFIIFTPIANTYIHNEHKHKYKYTHTHTHTHTCKLYVDYKIACLPETRV